MINLDRIKDIKDGRAAPLCFICDQLEEKTCHVNSCGECKWNNIDNCINFLKEEYKEKIKLSRFEYDLLINCNQANDYNEDSELNEYWIIKGMQEKGYFKNVDLDMTFKEIIERIIIDG